jgi:O-antigen ligase
MRLSADSTTNGLAIKYPRFAIWKGHINMFLDSPLFGYGYAFITDDLKSKFFDLSHFQAHNSYLQLLVDMGLVGSALVISILAYCLYIFWKMMNEKGLIYSPILIRCFFFALFTNAMHAITQNNFFESSTVTVYLIIAWIIMWLRVQEKNEDKLLC